MARFSWSMFRRTTARPPAGEVAGSSIGLGLAPYIGELPLSPHASTARYAYSLTDETYALQIYRAVLRDERCAAALDQRLNAAISKPWKVEPGGDADIDRQAAEDLSEQLKGIGFEAACRQLLHGVWYGWAVGEAIWSRDASRVVLDDIVVRSPDRFWWSPDGRLLLRSWASPQGAPVPAGKFVVLARPGEHGDLPYAPGLARWCYWPVWLKRHGLKFWSVALEKFGAPTAIGKYPRGASPEEQTKLLSLVQSLATGAGAAIPEDQVVELLATAQRTGGSGGMDFSSFVEYLDRGITTTILGQSSTTDQGPWRGTAEVQKDVRDETIAADTRLLDEALNGTVVRWLTQWNYPTAAIPKLRHDADPPEDLDARAKRDEVVARTAGLRPTADHVRDVYGGGWEEMPRPDIERTAAALARAMDANPLLDVDGALNILRRRALAEPDGDAVDRALDRLLDRDGWEPVMEPVVEPILAEAAAALERGESLEAFRDRLPALFADMDSTHLVETLRRMGFSARLSGDAGLEED